MITDETELTSGRTDTSVLSLPVLPVPGTRVQGGSVQQLFTSFVSMSGKTGCTITKLTLETLKMDFSTVLFYAMPNPTFLNYFWTYSIVSPQSRQSCELTLDTCGQYELKNIDTV